MSTILCLDAAEIAQKVAPETSRPRGVFYFKHEVAARHRFTVIQGGQPAKVFRPLIPIVSTAPRSNDAA